MQTEPTVIIGAGPAGCSAAITLARSGARVALVDKATFPRDKICGDGLTTSALRELEALGFRPTECPAGRRSTTLSFDPPAVTACAFRCRGTAAFMRSSPGANSSMPLCSTTRAPSTSK
ncbi:MAG: FAD-dependent oxidoreductase [Candidatus Microthrix sp.]|nr:FAD-dependent oxidoreductase [Candidatus Microthrix sp.]